MTDRLRFDPDNDTGIQPHTETDAAEMPPHLAGEAVGAAAESSSTPAAAAAADGSAGQPVAAGEEEAGDGSSLLERLESEGDAAADFLEDLLDIADLDGDIDLDVDNGRAAVSIVGGDLGVLIGPEGAVLEALQELTRLAVLRETGERSRLMLDVAGHRAARRAALEREAAEAAATVQSSGTPLRLTAMTPFERKVVHDAIAAAGLRSESEGEEPQRRVVVLPAAEAAY